MKAVLEFDFNGDNFDRTEFEDAINGGKWKMAKGLFIFCNAFR